ncbi:ANL family adenylate-forming protein [Marinobacter shengliensis]|uniref:ANL family adenylate-forming protein n=1 Tax=Marinobacter shengliensis TaxID=1389223 RepID=UPI001109A134|nr:class I adenylate-forming enzyme family protein [Marinobacter shengliensis]
MLRNFVTGKFSVVSDVDTKITANTDDAQQVLGLDQVSGKNVALHCHPQNLIKWAVELDGLASSVLLVPFDACGAFSKRAEEKLDLDVVLTDGMTSTGHWTTKVSGFRADSGSQEATSSLGRRKTQWLLITSGTTGTPKVVAHTLESLTRTTAKSGAGSQLTWGLLYDPARFAGFQVVLQAMMSNAKLVVPSPDLDFEKKIDFLVANGCDALSATPSLWRKILMAKAARQLHLKQVTLGGEIADQRILNSLAKQYPSAAVTHIFASTEAGVGFSVKDKKAGFPLSWLDSGARGVEMRISDQGTLCLKNTHLNQNYLGGGSIASTDGWIDTGDLVEVDGDRVLFKGRLNGAINIGGNKVIPEDVEARILEVPGVFQVAVRSKSSSIAGALVEALVVPDPELDNPSGLVKSVKQHCKQVLPSFKVPAFVRLVDELPVGSAGKIKR